MASRSSARILLFVICGLAALWGSPATLSRATQSDAPGSLPKPQAQPESVEAKPARLAPSRVSAPPPVGTPASGSTPPRSATPSPAVAEPKVWRNTLGMEFVRIEPGEFTMGTTPEQVSQLVKLFPRAKAADFDAEQPAHKVRLSRAFEVGRNKVTVGQFHAFVEETHYPADADADQRVNARPRPWFPQQEDHPMVNVTWDDVQAFCRWLEARENGLVKYRLPTEAEWEYTCRAGTKTLFPNGDDPEQLARIGNVADASAHAKYPGWTWTIQADDGHVYASPVGTFAPNAWGLYDMIGNVWEWCEDRYEHDYYATLPTSCVDPRGPAEGSMRVVRGSCWFLDIKRCRPADRGGFAPGFRCAFLGFRLVAVRKQ